MIFNMTGGGDALNFQVKAYQSETELKSDSPKVNTIGIITTTTMTSWVFSATEPAETEVGMVWISVGTSSDSAFNALKKNDLHVYPQSTKQMVFGEFADVDAMFFNGETWLDLKKLFVVMLNSEFVDTIIEAVNGEVKDARSDGSGRDFFKKGEVSSALILKTKDKIPKYVKQLEVTGRYISGSADSRDYKEFFLSEADTWPESFNSKIATFNPFTTISGANSTKTLDISGVNVDAYLWIAYGCAGGMDTAIVIKDIKELR